uniref:Secreted protein n=1 Tax=Heterorhabditis bacteriophora TaxID=37862 RepID=A0A1I7XPK7_HETBA
MLAGCKYGTFVCVTLLSCFQTFAATQLIGSSINCRFTFD